MGVEIETIKPGDGKSYPKKGQKVNVHYTGTFTNGQKFDSSRDRGQPLSFRIGHGEVIHGWEEGILKMSIGQRAKLICGSDSAYGESGYPGVIPPNCTLLFDLELLSIG
ncbi:peptidyl-prolyl cis-trans isomerase FKBP1B-like [Styela clava]|uniref:peptidyl-prolyl cis-trans isomerase FKBP1B-like n=1 Tax=Styela clava TaxID=7725 RepID=UPI001939CB32|nr:peptidyl-prolyl cis-trans isomerase FKBP1B-like [Styela clava]XP_039272531.1 peptidyl-prolyl cis-trans isomerase FKBP1B-like [Styela clava]